MNIELPKQFSYYSNNRSGWARVENGFLLINDSVSWRKVAYSLAYAVKGKKKCSYCGKNIRKKKATIDHMFPKNYGGVSIPNNLTPSCTECNSIKGDLNQQQFMFFRNLKSSQRLEYKKSIYKLNEGIRYSVGFDLPSRWVTRVKITTITTGKRAGDDERGKNYNRVKNFWEKYNNLPSPIVISSNNVLLENYLVYKFALDIGIKVVPVIRLENVVVN